MHGLKQKILESHESYLKMLFPSSQTVESQYKYILDEDFTVLTKQSLEICLKESDIRKEADELNTQKAKQGPVIINFIEDKLKREFKRRVKEKLESPIPVIIELEEEDEPYTDNFEIMRDFKKMGIEQQPSSVEKQVDHKSLVDAKLKLGRLPDDREPVPDEALVTRPKVKTERQPKREYIR